MAASRPVIFPGLRVAVLWLVLAGAGCVQPPAHVELAGGDGGEAWTFEKLLLAQVSPEGCDTVRFTSPAGSTLAAPQAGQALARVPLRAGENGVRAECIVQGRARGGDGQVWDVRLAERPTARVRAIPQEDSIVLDAGASALPSAAPAPLVRFEWRGRPDNPARLAGLPAQGRRVVLPLPPRDGEYAVTLRVTDAAGRSDESGGLFRVSGGEVAAVDLAREPPAWVKDAVVYGVAPFFFGPGRLTDVTARLDEIAALGVDTLWLSPITATAEGDFGYAVTDFFQLRPDFGSEADLRALVDGAHERGMRVIIDFVPNHVAAEHRYYEAAQAQDAASAYFSFFDRAADGTATHYFDWEHLINLNFDNPEVKRWVIEGFAYWVRNFDVDGFRVDVAWGPRRRAPEFWAEWRREMDRIKPDMLLLAEATARDPYYPTAGFDAAYDWTEELGEWAWREAFETPDRTAALLRRAIVASRAPAREESLVFRFLNNNDTGRRFITRYGLPRTKLAAVLLLTLPGLPMIYTGQEVGAAFEPYDEGPPLAWTDRQGLRPWYQRLIGLRRAVPALSSDAIEMVQLSPADKLLAYLRPAGWAGAPDILVLLNWSAEPLETQLPTTVSGEQEPVLVDLLAGERLRADRAVSLPGYGARILSIR